VNHGAGATEADDLDETAEPSLGPVLDFLRLLWAVDHGLQSASKRMHARFGVSGLQRMMIRIIGRFPGTSAGDVSRLLHVHPSTITGALDRLVKAGMVVRKVDPQDARRARLSLGAKGRSIDAIRTRTVEAAVRAALESVPERKVAAAAEVLSAIARELERSEA
jgi:DNA-binding MarR family transcriptional regulator